MLEPQKIHTPKMVKSRSRPLVCTLLGGSAEMQLQGYLTTFNMESFDSSIKDFELSVHGVAIGPRVLSLIVQLLNQSLPASDTQNGEDTKWSMVRFVFCQWTRPTRPSDNVEERLCTPDEMCCLSSALGKRTRCLELCHSPQILGGLLRTPEIDTLDSINLKIDAPDFVRYAEMIQSCARLLTKLDLYLPAREAPLELHETLANLFSLQELSFQVQGQMGFHVVSDAVSNLWERNGAVARLLQNPQSHLKHLDLEGMPLSREQFISLVQMLPASQIQYLNVANTGLHWRSILEFSSYLPVLKSLKKIALRPNPWAKQNMTSSDDKFERCGPALVFGLLENFSIEDLDAGTIRNLNTLEGFPESSLLMHFTTLNRAGRRILASDAPVPLGLWPLILERAGTTLSYPVRKTNLGKQRQLKANAVYYFLRFCPILVEDFGHPMEFEMSTLSTWVSIPHDNESAGLGGFEDLDYYGGFENYEWVSRIP